MLAFAWSEVRGLDEGKAVSPRGVPFAGLRITPVDGAGQNLLVAVPRALRAAHPARTWASSVARELQEQRQAGPAGTGPSFVAGEGFEPP